MPRYFFHTVAGAANYDGDGIVLANDEAARMQATRTLGQLIDLSPEELWMDRRLTVTVANQAGETLFVLEATGTVPSSAQPG